MADEEVQQPEQTEQPDEKDPLADEVLTGSIKELAKHFINLDKWVRRSEVIECRRQRFYLRNDQYIYWKSDSVGFIPATGGSTVVAGDTAVNLPRYTDVYNIYTPFGESLIATLTQNPPGVNWQAIDPSKPADLIGQQTAEKYQQKIEADNDRKNLQAEVSRLFYTDGRTVLFTRSSKEGDREIITAHGVLETKVVPLTAKKLENLVALYISEDIDIYEAKGEYPDQAKEIKKGTAALGESAYERIARLGVLQGTRLLMQAGDAFDHLVTRHHVFLRPSTYEKAEEAEEQLKEEFPDGIHAVFCGDTLCEIENLSMDDCISIGFPTPGDGMSRPSMGKRVIPVQDVFNDELNLWHEAHDYCVPTTFYWSETAETDAINLMISQPGNLVPISALPPGATSMAEAFYEAALEAVPSTLPALIEFLQGPFAQFLTGAFPALFGGDTGKNDTAKGIAIQRDQAMGRMGIPWAALQELFASAYRQAVKFAVKNNEGGEFTYTTTDRGGNQIGETLKVSDLAVGHYTCVPDTDSTFPETTSAKRVMIQTLLTAAERNPVIADVMSQPKNMELAHEIIGLPELDVPSASADVKQTIEIGLLLRESPIPPGPMDVALASQQNPEFAQSMLAWKQQVEGLMANGAPPNTLPRPPIPIEMYKPSIQVDPDFDFHPYEYQTVKDWLSSEACRKEQLAGNVKGIQNVRLHGLQHKKIMDAEQMQQQLLAQNQPKPIGPAAAKPKLEHAASGKKTPQPETQTEGNPSAQSAPQVM